MMFWNICKRSLYFADQNCVFTSLEIMEAGKALSNAIFLGPNSGFLT